MPIVSQTRSGFKRRLVAGATAVAILLACAYGGLSWWASGQSFKPWRYPSGDWGQQHSLGTEDVWLTAADGVRPHGWWTASAGSKFATLCLHGNGYNVTTRAEQIQGITSAGSDVLVIDHRGYGRGSGRPSERGPGRDADAGYEFVLKTGKPVIIQGQSPGTAVAVDLAVGRPGAGLILEMPFTNGRDIARRVSPLAPLVAWGSNCKRKTALELTLHLTRIRTASIDRRNRART
jgi:pimeloyl-ACP methyl ester carboxylesterase